MINRSTIVTFQLNCRCPRVWIAIEGVGDSSQRIEMRQALPTCWTTSAWLLPGEYVYRYHSEDGSRLPGHRQEHRIAVASRFSIVNAAEIEVSTPCPSFSTSILLVEDNLATLSGMAKTLREAGHDVHAADGYQAAVALGKRENFDLVICDINLWDGDGCDLLQELAQTRMFKAIAVTGYTLPNETKHFQEAGFAIVLHKPAHFGQLSSAMSSLNFGRPKLRQRAFPA